MDNICLYTYKIFIQIMSDKNFQGKLFFVVDGVTTVYNDLYILYGERLLPRKGKSYNTHHFNAHNNNNRAVIKNQFCFH